MENTAEKSVALFLENALFFSKGERERERVHHFKESANALQERKSCAHPLRSS